MKNKLLMIIGVLAIAGTSANAGWFGAGIKPVPYLKVPFVKLVVPVPSAVVGPRAGTEVDANVSTAERMWHFLGLREGSDGQV